MPEQAGRTISANDPFVALSLAPDRSFGPCVKDLYPPIVKRAPMLRLAILPLLFLLLTACGVEEPKAFTSIDQASAWYLTNAVTDDMSPDSKAISHAAYCGSSPRRVLLVAFTSNPSKHYVHEGVPKSVWDDFQGADSKGKYYNANIRGRYGFKIGPGP